MRYIVLWQVVLYYLCDASLWLDVEIDNLQVSATWLPRKEPPVYIWYVCM
jgi:hypothetical protein